MDRAHVVVVGGGGTGGALAHDLVLRGLRVTLLERGELTSGTTGRHHGLLHSGARYAVNDPESAVECIAENRILRQIAPGSFEENGGLFVALTDEDMDYKPGSWPPAPPATSRPGSCARPRPWPWSRASTRASRRRCGCPTRPWTRCGCRCGSSPRARLGGAELRPFTEVTGVLRAGRRITGVVTHDHVTGADGEVAADLVVNATGPWCERLAAMAGAAVPVQPSPGVLLALSGRLCELVVNRLHRAGDGDIVVPQRALSIVGTSAWTVEDPDDLEVPDEHVEAMYREGAKLIPAVATATERAAWSAARPLIGAAGGASGGRELSRTFKCFDHAATDGVEGFVTITGGKATTLRAMAEAAADLVCAKLGVDAPCRTREVVLAPHTAYYTGRAA